MVRGMSYMLAALTIGTLGCQPMTGIRGSGIEKTEIRQVESFDAVALSGSGRMEVTLGDASPLSITADDNLLELIESKVVDGRLTIRPTQNINPSSEIVLKVSTPALRQVKCSGATKLVIHGARGEELKIAVSGASTVHADGQVGRFEVAVSGAGDIFASELKSDEVQVTISGAGSAQLHAEKKLKATISGAGSITYSGTPEVDQQVSGAGTIKRKS